MQTADGYFVTEVNGVPVTNVFIKNNGLITDVVSINGIDELIKALEEEKKIQLGKQEKSED